MDPNKGKLTTSIDISRSRNPPPSQPEDQKSIHIIWTGSDWPDQWQPSRQRSSASYRATCCPRSRRSSVRSDRGQAHRKSLSHHNDSKDMDGVFSVGDRGHVERAIIKIDRGYTVNIFIHFVQNIRRCVSREIWIIIRGIGGDRGQGTGGGSRLPLWCILNRDGL